MRKTEKNSKIQAPKNKQIQMNQNSNSKHKPDCFELLKQRSQFGEDRHPLIHGSVEMEGIK